MTRHASKHPIQVAKRLLGRQLVLRHGSVGGKERLMSSGDGWQVPPSPHRPLEPTVHPRLVGQEDRGRCADTQIGEDVLHLTREVLRADPQRRRDGATTDPRQPPAQLMPKLALALRDRVRNQTPAVRRAHLARRVDAPIAASQRRNSSGLQRIAGASLSYVGGEYPLATHPENGRPGTSLVDPDCCHQLHQGCGGNPAAKASQIAPDDGAKQ